MAYLQGAMLIQMQARGLLRTSTRPNSENYICRVSAHADDEEEVDEVI